MANVNEYVERAYFTNTSRASDANPVGDHFDKAETRLERRGYVEMG
jgi:hypothetical protein